MNWHGVSEWTRALSAAHSLHPGYGRGFGLYACKSPTDEEGVVAIGLTDTPGDFLTYTSRVTVAHPDQSRQHHGRSDPAAENARGLARSVDVTCASRFRRAPTSA